MGGMRVALFITCLADQFYAEAGVAAVRLLRALGVEVDFPKGQTCCGQPAFNAGIVRPSVHAGSPLAPLTLGLPKPFRGGFLPQYGQGL